MTFSEVVSSDQFGQLLTDETPLIDLRAPVEFNDGAFPGALNLWLMTDEERTEVGICYKQRGHDAAVELGHQRVSGVTRERRIRRWVDQLERAPDTRMYCFRGGQRSEIAQQWLADAGFEVPRIDGGYKALRRFLMTSLSRLSNRQSILILGGLAGSGKTDLLAKLPASLDLEGFANHRGSAFGRRVSGHPTPINFEHALTIAWLKLERAGSSGIVTEDESRTIGRLALPQPLWEALIASPIAVIEESIETRIQRIIRDYVKRNLADWMALDPERGFERFASELLASLSRVEKRLGGVRFKAMQTSMQAALNLQASSGSTADHESWVKPLLVDYYDPMYAYQLEKKSDRVVFRGTAEAVAQYSQSTADPLH
ncbi:MAG: tRNA 2-selenouridine(34) synthase MnmH [Lysobacterales bacterium]